MDCDDRYDHDNFHASLHEAREVLGPDFEGLPADPDGRLDAADKRIACLKTLVTGRSRARAGPAPLRRPPSLAEEPAMN